MSKVSKNKSTACPWRWPPTWSRRLASWRGLAVYARPLLSYNPPGRPGFQSVGRFLGISRPLV